MTDSSRSCPECGALNHASADTCDLCGSRIESESSDAPRQEAAAPGTFCNDCGARNPAGAKFCSQCGERLQVAAAPVGTVPEQAAAPEPVTSEAPAPEGIGKQVALLVGGAVLIVMALYMVTLVSKQNVTTGGAQAAVPPSPTTVLEQQGSEPLDAEVSARADELRAAIAGADGSERSQQQRALIDLLYGAGRADMAAVEAQYVAEESGQAQDWRDAGDLYFQWMETADPTLRADLAHLTIFAYERVLEQNPDHHDVRANVAWAAQYDAANPMRAIDETNYILEREPDHVQANFNRGYFLMRINRFDQAAEQMERVLELADEGSPVARQASTLIQIIMEEQSRLRGSS